LGVGVKCKKFPRKNKIKIKEKLKFLRKISFRQTDFGFWCNSKIHDIIT